MTGRIAPLLRWAESYYPSRLIEPDIAAMNLTDAELIEMFARVPSRRGRLKDDPELQEVIDRGRAVGRATLRRMQWQAAENGNPTMLIWLGKQMLDQKDKVENSGTMDTNTRLIVELVGDPAPQQVEHDKQQRQAAPRLVNSNVIEWKG
jgi:hypothetical protein